MTSSIELVGSRRLYVSADTDRKFNANGILTLCCGTACAQRRHSSFQNGFSPGKRWFSHSRDVTRAVRAMLATTGSGPVQRGRDRTPSKRDHQCCGYQQDHDSDDERERTDYTPAHRPVSAKMPKAHEFFTPGYTKANHGPIRTSAVILRPSSSFSAGSNTSRV